MNQPELRAQLCLAAQRLWNRGLMVGSEGNLSCRLDAERLLATPAGRIKVELEPGDLVVTDLGGAPIGAGTPSTEIGLHVAIYRALPECFAIVHAHPPTATGFSVSGRTIPSNVLPEADRFLGPVALVPYAEPGTEQLGRAIAPFLKNHKTFLLAHHGAVALGSSVEEAFCRMESLEQVAKIVLTAEVMGRINKI